MVGEQLRRRAPARRRPGKHQGPGRRPVRARGAGPGSEPGPPRPAV